MVMAGVVGGAVALGGGGTASLDALSALRSRPAQTSKSSARNVEVRTFARLKIKGYQVKQNSRSQFGSCKDKAYGQVERFFAAHPCRSLHRFMAELVSPSGISVLVAVSVVDMPNAASAAEFKDLVDVHGTGNVLELPKEMRRYRTVEFTGYRYGSRQDDTLVTNVQVEPFGRSRSAAIAAEVLSLALEAK
ncbi:hypothetical protein [Saccharopolyspora spinosa]|uniref:hypothetical protein n=1 Tax=Saccharopolyspora spinosa TaxID=60894 RepID=UPI0002379891|nr:hypothetical protein [Saccharopolyspora spinosa]